MSQDPERRQVEDLLVQQALGEVLQPEERARLARAVAQDPELAAEAASLQRTADALALAAVAKPPSSLRTRVVSAVQKNSGRHPRIVRTAWRTGWQTLAAGVAIIALLGCLLLGYDNWRLRRDTALQQVAARLLREPNVVLSFDLAGTGDAAGARGAVLLDLDAKRASITVQRLAALPDGKRYYLWAMLGKTKVPCGDFEVLPDGRILAQFQIPVDSYTSPIDSLAMTIESGTGVAAPQGPVVMTST